MQKQRVKEKHVNQEGKPKQGVNMETAKAGKQLNKNGARGIEDNCELSEGRSRRIGSRG